MSTIEKKSVRLAFLQAQHKVLDKEIRTLSRSYASDDILATKKRHKLKVKEEMVKLQGEISA